MKVSVTGFIYHKASERFSDCFDRYGLSTENNKFAVSDGVSKSFFSGIWAELLVNSFVDIKGKVNLADAESLTSIQNQWLSKIEEIVSEPNQKFFVRNLHAQRRSAAATFVGLHFFNSSGKYKWEAFALGDSFMFFVPEETTDISKNFKQVQFLSSKKDFEFDNFPDFFDSRSKTNKGKIKQVTDNLKAGAFYLMTDALSQWFISEKHAAVHEISDWTSQDVFERRIQLLRKGSLQNDDVAILIIKVEGEDDSNIQYGDVQITDLNKLLNFERKQLDEHEAEWKLIEKELHKKFEIEKQQAEKVLKEKQHYEQDNYDKQFIEYIRRRQEDAKNELMHQHAKEWEQFEREWKREFERERVRMEQQLSKKQEDERMDLEQHYKNRFEKEKEEKRKILAYKGGDQFKKKDSAIIPPTIQEGNQKSESIISRPVDDFDKKNFPERNDVKKNKGFWETTIEIGAEAIDTFSNLIRRKDHSPTEDVKKIEKNSRTRIIKVTGEEKNAKKNKPDDDKDSDSNKDISSITDKF